MKRIKIVGPCIVAMFAVSLVASTTASAALPEWGKCVRFVNQHGVNVGKYEDGACTKPVSPEAPKTGPFEWMPAPKGTPNSAFTSHGGAAVLETTLGPFTQVKCSVEEATGSLKGNKEVSEVSVRFKGCHLSFNEPEPYTCGNGLLPPQGSEKEGEIVTRRLKGKLGYISGKGEENPSVGLSLEPEERKGLFAQFMCAERFLVIRVGVFPGGKGNDSIISPIAPVNKMSISNTQTYKNAEKETEPGSGKFEVEPGIQDPTHFEGGKEDYLESETSYSEGLFGPISQSAQSLTTVNTLNSGEELEIRAFVAP
jgi:hypothetical protein